MDRGKYLRAWRAAGRFTAPPYTRPFSLTRGIPVDLPPEPKAIYVAARGGEALYVGSTTRGVTVRIREHVRDRDRASWEDLWVIGLADGITPYQVLLAEERVGRLVLPRDNVRSPGR